MVSGSAQERKEGGAGGGGFGVLALVVTVVVTVVMTPVVTLVPDDAAMTTTTPVLIAQLDATLRTSDARRSFATLRASEPAVARSGASSYLELSVEAGVEATSRSAYEIAAVLLCHSDDPLAACALVWMMCPALVAMGRRVAWRAPWHGDTDAAVTDTVTICWQQITRLAGQRSPYALRQVLAATHSQLRNVTRSETRHGHQRLEHATPLAAHTERSAAEQLAVMLDDPSTPLSSIEHQVLYATAVYGLSNRETARQVARDESTIRRIRSQAARTLSAA